MKTQLQVQEALYAAKIEDDSRSIVRAKRVLDRIRPTLKHAIRQVLWEKTPAQATLRLDVSLKPDGKLEAISISSIALSDADAQKVSAYLENRLKDHVLGTLTPNGVRFDHLFSFQDVGFSWDTSL